MFIKTYIHAHGTGKLENLCTGVPIAAQSEPLEKILEKSALLQIQN